MCAAALLVHINPVTFVAPELLVGALKRVYAGVVMPVDQTNLRADDTVPPERPKLRGRPKEKRYISSAEKKPRRQVTCKKCGELGHNSRTCKKQSK